MTIYVGDKKISSKSEVSVIPSLSYKDYIEGNLEHLVLPNYISKLKFACFRYYPLKNITFNNIITEIPGKCFEQCPNLESVFIPKNIEIIEDYAFRNCPKLQYVEFEKNSPITTLSCCFYGCESLTQIVNIPQGIQEFAPYEFIGCESLESIEIPQSLTVISTVAFAYCKSLTEITIPSSIEGMGNEVFYGCTNLKTITINKPQDSISGAPWGATNATVVWNG